MKENKILKIILVTFVASIIIGSCTGCLKRKNDSTYTSEAIADETTDATNLTSSQADSEQTLEIYARDLFSNGLLSSKLVYDTNTKVIYIVSYYGEYTPYLSENGNYCRYIDGEIVDIEK